MRPGIALLRKDVHRLSLPDGRMVGTRGHEIAKEYLIHRFRELSLAPYSGDSFCLPYYGEAGEFTNVVGVVRSERSCGAPVLIGAHYDSVIAAPCADDNAAAVAIALGAAAVLRERKLDRDVIIAMFDAEEPPYFQSPCMGSFRFREDQLQDEGVHAAIIMDLVGHDVVVPLEYVGRNRVLSTIERMFPKLENWEVPFPIVRDLLFITGGESHPTLPRILSALGPPRRLRPVATLNEYIGDMSDQGAFRLNGVPYLFLSCGRWPHYHVKTDTSDRLNYRKMHRIMKYLNRIVEILSHTSLEDSSGAVDTAAFEIETLKRSLGPLLPPLLRVLGISRLENRQDIDALAQTLLATGL